MVEAYATGTPLSTSIAMSPIEDRGLYQRGDNKSDRDIDLLMNLHSNVMYIAYIYQRPFGSFDSSFLLIASEALI